jgi:hypothetical protein
MGSQGSRETERRQLRHRAFEALSRPVSARAPGRYLVWGRVQSPLRPVIIPRSGAPGVGQDVPIVDDVSLDQSGPQIVRHWTESPRERGDFDAADSL